MTEEKAKKQAEDYLQQLRLKAELISSEKPKVSSHSTETKHYDNIRNVTTTSIRYEFEISYALAIATTSLIDAGVINRKLIIKYN